VTAAGAQGGYHAAPATVQGVGTALDIGTAAAYLGRGLSDRLVCRHRRLGHATP